MSIVKPQLEVNVYVGRLYFFPASNPLFVKIFREIGELIQQNKDDKIHYRNADTYPITWYYCEIYFPFFTRIRAKFWKFSTWTTVIFSFHWFSTWQPDLCHTTEPQMFSVGQLSSQTEIWDLTPGQKVLLIPNPSSTNIFYIHSHILPSLLYFPHWGCLLLLLTILCGQVSITPICLISFMDLLKYPGSGQSSRQVGSESINIQWTLDFPSPGHEGKQ